jgi:hypothetical protein
MTGPLLRRPHLVLPLLLWVVGLALVPRVGEGAPLPPAATEAVDPAELEARLVVARLVALGASPEDARAWLARSSDDERRALAERLDEVGAGGTVAAVLAIGIIVGLVAVLLLELIGRRVVSRPAQQ